MLTNSGETGRTLPNAPEFGPNGAWPPITTDWIPLSWALFQAQSSEIDPAAEAVMMLMGWPDLGFSESIPNAEVYAGGVLRVTEENFLPERLSRYPQRTVQVIPKRGRSGRVTRVAVETVVADSEGTTTVTVETSARGLELRRAIRSIRWCRKDPVTQLPPGVTDERMHTVTTGLSIESTQKLAESLGISLGTNVGNIHSQFSSQVQQELGLKLNVTSEEQQSTKLTLVNPSDTKYRLYALWHVEQRISVDALTITASEAPTILKTAWKPRQLTESVVPSDPHLTYAEIGRS